MFNIESSHGDLVDQLRTQSDKTEEFENTVEALGSEMDSVTDTLTTMYFQLNDIEDAANNGYLGLEFPHVPGLGDLDDNAAEVVRDLMTELTASLMSSIRDLTRFDRVDRR